MADTALHSMTQKTSPATTDEMYIETPGSPASNYRITVPDLMKIINALTADSAPRADADYVMTYDASAAAPKKVLLQNLGGNLPFMYYTAITADSNIFAASLPFQITPISWVQETIVTSDNSGNNGSHYWNITIKTFDSGATVASFTTATHTVATHTVTTTTSFSISPIATTRLGLYIEAIKTGTPGNLYFSSPAFTFSAG